MLRIRGGIIVEECYFELKCIKNLEGFTIGKTYPLLGCAAEYVSTIDDNSNQVTVIDGNFETVEVTSTGIKSLIRKVKADCDKEQACFNPNGCNHEFYRSVPSEGAMKTLGNTSCVRVSKCFHKYCDKFKWIIDRAKHYAEKTGLNWTDILDSWEERCNYWYVNYYQDCNQPKIEGNKVKVFDTVKDLHEAIKEKQFRCPCCGGVSTSPYKCNSGLEIEKATKRKPAKICDWNVNGLFTDLGKGIYVFCKDKLRGETFFMPLAWEDEFKEKPKLKCETNTSEVCEEILKATRKHFHKRKGISAFFEHGQWYVSVIDKLYSVCDAEGSNTTDGFGFDEISKGE